LDKIIEDNNRIIAEQHSKLSELAKESDGQKHKDAEKVNREIEEQKKKRDDEIRFRELEFKAQQEKEKDKVLNKNKARQNISFSLFG